MRISRCFTRTQINMDSITVGIEPSGLARIILMFQADDQMADFMRRVIARLEPIVDVGVIEPERSIVREISLIKTRPLEERELLEVVQKVEQAGGRVLDLRGNVLIAELGGDHEDVERVIRSLGPDIFKEVARSGQVYMARS